MGRLCKLMNDTFYIAGGTLPQNASSYVVRQADAQLFEGLRRGDFCYVLNTRQMGKSSLMIRTAQRLKADGWRIAILDLTAIGQNVTVEQWYDGLLTLVAEQLRLRDALEDFWLEQDRLGPMQRWMQTLQKVVLEPSPEPLCIFIDEIDSVRSLPFSVDEFFAGIRECYNRRTYDPAFARLSFCLLGVATPEDLIEDTRISPFNIGQRIELQDFGSEEAESLAPGLMPTASGSDEEPAGQGKLSAPSHQGGYAHRRAVRLLHRMLYWTGGHPYMTQRLCQAAVEELAKNPPSRIDDIEDDISDQILIDGLVDRLFLSKTARETDYNLAFVRNRLLKSEADQAALLDLYLQVRTGRRVRDDETSPLYGVLRLSGIVALDGGYLRLRNRIYERVFDAEWARNNMPEAEVLRQRRAYRTGVLRTASVFTSVLAVMGVLTVWAVRSDRKTHETEEKTRTLLYATRINLVQQELKENNLQRAQELLKTLRPASGQKDLRGFEWRYLWQLCHREEATLPVGASVNQVAYSPDGRLLACAGTQSDLLLWDALTRRPLDRLQTGARELRCVAFSPDSRQIAVADGDNTVLVIDLASRKRVAVFAGHEDAVNSIAFSPNGRLLATGSHDKTVRLWSLETRQPVQVPMGNDEPVTSVLFTPDGRSLAYVTMNEIRGVGLARFWSLETRKLQRSFEASRGVITFAPRADWFACSDPARPTAIDVYAMSSGKKLHELQGEGIIQALQVSPNGKALAAAYQNASVALWEIGVGNRTPRRLASLPAHTRPVASLCFSPDSMRLATGSTDEAIKIWKVMSLPDAVPFNLYTNGTFSYQTIAAPADRGETTYEIPGPLSTAFAPDGETVAVSFAPHFGSVSRLDRYGMGWYRIADATSRGTDPALPAYLSALQYSPDGKRLLAADLHGNILLWNAATMRRLSNFKADKTCVFSAEFAPDGGRFATADNDGTVKLWSSEGQILQAPLAVASVPVTRVAFSPDGTMLATVVYDEVAIWDAASGRKRFSFSRLKQPVSDIAFSPDSRYLAISGEVGRVGVWEIASRQLWKTFVGHNHVTNSVCFSPDGMTLATSSSDRTVKLWNIESGNEMCTLSFPESFTRLAFSKDGTHLAISGTAFVWILQAPRLSSIEAAVGL